MTAIFAPVAGHRRLPGRHRRRVPLRIFLSCTCGRVGLFTAALAECAMAAGARPVSYAGAVHLGLIAIVVSEYDRAISFFVDGLGFELVEDSLAQTNDGRPKR